MSSTVDILIKFKTKLLSPEISDDTVIKLIEALGHICKQYENCFNLDITLGHQTRHHVQANLTKIKVLSSLKQITITSADLGESKIGRVVAKLKASSNSNLSYSARSLVNIWKALVEKEVINGSNGTNSDSSSNEKYKKEDIKYKPNKRTQYSKDTFIEEKNSLSGKLDDRKTKQNLDEKLSPQLHQKVSEKSSSGNPPDRSLFDQFQTVSSLSESNDKKKKQKSLNPEDGSYSQCEARPSTSKSSNEKVAVKSDGVDNTCGLSFSDCLGGLDVSIINKNKKRPFKSPTDPSKKRKSEDILMKMPAKLKKLEITREDILSDVADSVKERVQEVSRVKTIPTVSLKEKLEDSTFGSLKITTGITLYKGKSRAAKADGSQTIPTLEHLCIRVLIQNINLLDHVGGVPYMILHPVLEACSPQQLERLEKYNPIFLEDSDEIWQKHVERKHRGSMQPRPGQTWRELFLKGKQEEEEKFNKLTKSLASSIQSSHDKRRTIGWIADAKPPRDVKKRQERYKTGHMETAACDPLVRLGGQTRHFPQPKLTAYTSSTRYEIAPSTSRSAGERKSFIKKPREAPLMKKIVRQIKKDNFRPYC